MLRVDSSLREEWRGEGEIADKELSHSWMSCKAIINEKIYEKEQSERKKRKIINIFFSEGKGKLKRWRIVTFSMPR